MSHGGLVGKVAKLKQTAYACAEKRPRQYAVDILLLPAEQQEEAILAAPEHLRAIVRDYVTSAHELRAALVRTHVERVLEQTSQEGRRGKLDRVPNELRGEVEAESRRRYRQGKKA